MFMHFKSVCISFLFVGYLKRIPGAGLAENFSVEESVEKRSKDGPKQNESMVSITVVGASGDLAKKKIFPALFALFYEECLPKVILLY